MPSDDAFADADRRRALERIVFAPGDPEQIRRAGQELDVLRRAQKATPRSASAPAPERVDTPSAVDDAAEVADPDDDDPGDHDPGDEDPGDDGLAAIDAAHPRRRPFLLAALAVGILAGGILIGTAVETPEITDAIATSDGGTGFNADPFLTGDPAASPPPGTGTAFIDINTGQVVGYGGTEAAPALEVFDREQTDADLPTFPLAADLQPSTTRLLETAGNASIFAAMDTLARPCLVVVGANQYAATCHTDFEFPKAGIRLSWAPAVAQATSPSESGRTSPVVYTVVWLADGMVEVGALIQGR